MPRPPFFTPADLLRITELCEQGLTTPRIAEQMGVTYLQVLGGLRLLGLTPTPALHTDRRPRAGQTRVIGIDQQKLIASWQQSGIPVKDLAQRLAIDWRLLSRELRGMKQMSPTRLARLTRLFTQHGQ